MSFSPTILDHYRRPRNFGALDAPDAVREGANPLCGDRVRFELAVGEGGRVAAVRFKGDACAIAVASASLLGERVAGGRAGDVAGLTLDDVLAMLGAPVAPGRMACARLPLDVLQAAARDCAVAPAGTVAALLLAAGASSRFGAQKLLQPLAGRPIVRHAAERLLEGTRARELVVVVGREGERVAAALNGLPARCVANARYADGLSTSVRAGVAALPREAPAVVVALGDQPFVPPGVVPRLLAAYRAGGAAIVAPRYRGGVRGHPVLFDAALFPEMLEVSGDEGARSVILRNADRARLVDFPLDAPADVDDAADYERLRSREG